MPVPAAPLRCLIVDDDPLAVQIVENCIVNTPFLQAVGHYNSSVEAAEFLRTSPVDVLFLDVEMPLMSGIELLRALPSPPLVVLITSSKEYAVEAFEFSVVDYLVKPISYARFLKAAQKALDQFTNNAPEPGAADSSEFTFVKVDNKLVKVLFDEVRYVEALGDYVHIVTGQSKLIVYSTMRAVEEKFPPALFVRVHRSFIVGMKWIQAIEDNAINIDHKLIPIGQTYMRDVTQRLNKF
ncbi:LytTR family DNA-binding domain-containing protein [Hymenobacter sp. J193]|uniref:LytR/AlgR family response regulator transcription factor n=1 Tax=Hymenobacter sp. J193 TaxID=2898429 RepID=UPI002151126F|nr:LytTR family DNA-binding domain-containing protein [Hymenobacter sp. J193]MCR5888762.1 LytTR family DNA-binding domain-containing protein [Hymenobacter sp. J193]